MVAEAERTVAEGPAPTSGGACGGTGQGEAAPLALVMAPPAPIVTVSGAGYLVEGAGDGE